VVNAISSTQGTSAAYQTNFANMQQMLIQQMFQAADSNGNGAVSKTEFEKFYNQFMDGNSTPTAQTTTAADQLYQQLSPTGAGLSQSQFASAVKQMMAQKAQGHADHHHGMNVSGTADSPASSASATSAAAKTPTAWLQSVLASANQNAAGQSVASQSSGSMEFIA
jgi:hypothetical protein